MSAINHYRAKFAALSRSRKADDPELIAAKQNLAEASLSEHISKATQTAPGLTPVQCQRLSALLTGGSK